MKSPLPGNEVTCSASLADAELRRAARTSPCIAARKGTEGRYAGRRFVFVVNTGRFFVSHRLELAKALIAEGACVSVLTEETGCRVEITDAGVEFVPIEMKRAIGSWAEEVSTTFAIWDAYRARKPDVVHHVALKSVVLGSLAARAAGVPCIVNAVTGLGHAFAGADRSLWAQSLIRTALPVACSGFNSRLIVQNRDDLEMFAANGWVRPGHSVLIRGSGVDCERFAATPEPPAPPFRVVLGGRMIWDKGIAEFVEVARRFTSSGRPVKFVLAGVPDAERPGSVPVSRLTSWADRGLIEWLGYRSDMEAVLRRAHVAVLPSRGGEGLPKFLLEAAASGRPAVTTNVPGCREIVRHGVTGLLVPPGDADSLERAVSRLISDDELRRLLGRQAATVVRDGFGFDKVIKDTFAVYDELLGCMPLETDEYRA